MLGSLPLETPLKRVHELRGDKPWDRACAEGWEGVIAKRRDSLYEHKRSKHWLKMKCELTGDFVVGGFTDPQRSRVGLGALLVGFYEEGEFVFAGKVGTGFDRALLKDLRARFDAAEIEKPPFTVGTGLPRVRAHWVKPEVIVSVAFIEWTAHGKLRHSRLLGERTGKSPRTVTRPGS
jgi:ATP-dependent DNA ligase